MRIGFFTDSYRPYTSGVVRSIDTFSQELRQLGHEVYIFAPMYPGAAKEDNVFRFLSIPSPTNQDFAIPIPLSLQLGATVKKLRLDVIHVHSPFLLGRLGAIQARRRRIPLVMTYHTLYDQYVHYFPFARGASQWAVKIITRDFSNKCDLVIAPTLIIADFLHAAGIKVPVKVIPTGIYPGEFTTASFWLQKVYPQVIGKKMLLSIGRLGAEKNIAFLIRSFALIKAEEPNTVLVLVGDGPEREEYRKLADMLGIGEDVIFTGTLPRTQVISCYQEATAFVFASKTETQGIVLAEAKAAGLPVVAVAAFGSKEMVSHNADGFLVPAEEAIFARAVVRLLTDEGLRQKMSCQARNNAENLTAASCALRLAEAYDELCHTGLNGAAS